MVKAAFPVLWDKISKTPDLWLLLQGSGLSRPPCWLISKHYRYNHAIPLPQFLPSPCGTEVLYAQILVMLL